MHFLSLHVAQLAGLSFPRLSSPSAAGEGAYSGFRTLESNREAVPITPPESAHCPKQLGSNLCQCRRGLMLFILGVCAVPVSVGHVHITLN